MSWQVDLPSLFFFGACQCLALRMRMRMRMPVPMQQWEQKDAIQYRFEKRRGWTKAHI